VVLFAVVLATNAHGAGKEDPFARARRQQQKAVRTAGPNSKVYADGLYNLGLLYHDYKSSETREANVRRLEQALDYFRTFVAHPKADPKAKADARKRIKMLKASMKANLVYKKMTAARASSKKIKIKPWTKAMKARPAKARAGRKGAKRRTSPARLRRTRRTFSGRTRRWMGRPGGAVRLEKRRISRLRKAAAIFLRKGKINAAYRTCRKAVRLDRENVNLQVQWALIQARAGNLAGAVRTVRWLQSRMKRAAWRAVHRKVLKLAQTP
jgi:tetratricopeptide (TPR) repeat protein